MSIKKLQFLLAIVFQEFTRQHDENLLIHSGLVQKSCKLHRELKKIVTQWRI